MKKEYFAMCITKPHGTRLTIHGFLNGMTFEEKVQDFLKKKKISKKSKIVGWKLNEDEFKEWNTIITYSDFNSFNTFICDRINESIVINKNG